MIRQPHLLSSVRRASRCGRLVALVGPHQSGKMTLVRQIAREELGEERVDGCPLP